MAKKAKKKAASKRVAPKVVAPNVAVAEPEHIDMSPKPPVQDSGDFVRGPEDIVSITIPFRLKIARKVYEAGTHKVPRHRIPTMMEMVDKKRRSDLEVFTGKNYFVQKLVDRSLVVAEVEDLNLKRMTK